MAYPESTRMSPIQSTDGAPAARQPSRTDRNRCCHAGALSHHKRCEATLKVMV